MYTPAEVARLEKVHQHWVADEPDLAELMATRDELMLAELDLSASEGNRTNALSFHARSRADVEMHTAHVEVHAERTGAGLEFDRDDSWLSQALDAVAPVVEEHPSIVVVAAQPQPPRRTGRLRNRVIKFGEEVAPVAVVVPQLAIVHLPPAPAVPPPALVLPAPAEPQPPKQVEKRVSERKRKQTVMFVAVLDPRKSARKAKDVGPKGVLGPLKRRVRSHPLATAVIKDQRQAAKSVEGRKKSKA